jgi:hypothetical protein
MPSGTAANVTPPQHRQCPAPAFAGAGSAFHPGHHGTNHGQVDPVITSVQHLVCFAQRRLAVHAGHDFGDHRLIGIAGQRATAALAAQTALAWAVSPGFLRLVGLLALRWRQARIVRRLRWLAEPGFKCRNPPLGRLKPLKQRQDQRVLLGVAQVAEVGKLGHPKLESSRP